MGINYAALYEESPRHTDDIDWSLLKSVTLTVLWSAQGDVQLATLAGWAMPMAAVL